jgi:hypothetical protein
MPKPAPIENPEADEKEWQIEVAALEVGYYPNEGSYQAIQRKPGDVFKIRWARHLSPQWMRKVTAENANVPIYDRNAPRLDVPQTTLGNMVQDPLHPGLPPTMAPPQAPRL